MDGRGYAGVPVSILKEEPLKVALVETGETARAVPVWVQNALADAGVAFLEQPCKDRKDLEAYASDSEIVWIWGSRVITADSLDALTKCGAVLRSGSGTDNVPVLDATARGILVANTPGAVAQEVADHAIGLLLSVVRQIVAQDRLLRSGVWDFRRENNRWHLRGSTLGLVGFGRIAQLAAHKMKGFGVRMLAYDPWASSDQARSQGVELVDLDVLLTRSDFISIHCPLTEETHHLIGKQEIRKMKPQTILVNTSRGPVIDQAALIQALQQRRIGAAALDVFEEEPLPSSSPLLTLENVVLTPHIAGYSDLFPGSFWRYSVETLLALASGYWPRSVVNSEVIPKWKLVKKKWPLEPEGSERFEEESDAAVRRVELGPLS
jgi:D-3-phosphoglycerate dehydrogenase / 2-oxoglutarate reductase